MQILLKGIGRIGWSRYPYRFCFRQPRLAEQFGLPTFAPIELFARLQVWNFWNSLQGLTSCLSFIVTLPIQMNRTRISHTFCCKREKKEQKNAFLDVSAWHVFRLFSSPCHQVVGLLWPSHQVASSGLFIISFDALHSYGNFVFRPLSEGVFYASLLDTGRKPEDCHAVVCARLSELFRFKNPVAHCRRVTIQLGWKAKAYNSKWE